MYDCMDSDITRLCVCVCVCVCVFVILDVAPSFVKHICNVFTVAFGRSQYKPTIS